MTKSEYERIVRNSLIHAWVGYFARGAGSDPPCLHCNRHYTSRLEQWNGQIRRMQQALERSDRTGRPDPDEHRKAREGVTRPGAAMERPQQPPATNHGMLCPGHNPLGPTSTGSRQNNR